MSDYQEVITRILISRLLVEYWNATQDAIADFITGEIDADQLQETIIELDEYYTSKIIKERP